MNSVRVTGRHAIGAATWVVVMSLIVGLGTVMQVQEWRRAEMEREFLVQKQRADVLIMSGSRPVIACDPTHKITIANIAAEKLFGYDHNELLGKPISVIIPPELRARHDEAIDAAERRIKEQSGDWMLLRAMPMKGVMRDGKEIDLHLEVRTIKYEGRVEFVATFDPDGEKPTEQEIELPRLPPLAPAPPRQTSFAIQPQKANLP